MRALAALILYTVLVFAGAALLAPWLYWGIQSLAGSHSELSGIAHQPFHRYVHRTLLVLALAGLWPLARALGARSWSALGITPLSGQLGPIAFGFGLGFLSLAVVALLGVFSGARNFNTGIPLDRLLKLMGAAAGTALVVAVVEELLFRGMLYGRMRPAIGQRSALLLSAGIYAIVHFFERPSTPLRVTWTSGFQTLQAMLEGFSHWQSLIPGFFTLSLAGILLARFFRVTGSLYGAIALHAGWIFWLGLYRGITQGQPSTLSWVWGSEKLVDGWSALGVMILCAVLVWRWAGASMSNSISHRS